MPTDFKTNSIVGLGVTETAKGTFQDPTIAGVELYDLAPIKVDLSPVRVGELANGTFKKGKYYSGTRKGSTAFKAELKSSGDATVAPAIGYLLEASGMVEQVHTVDKVGYKFSGIPSCKTMSFKYQMYNCGALPAGFKQTLRGAKCNLKISAANVGAPVVLDFEIAGVAGDEADVASGAPLVATATDTTECQKFMGVTTVVGGKVVNMTSFEVAIQGELSYRTDSSNPDGLLYVDMTNADINLTAGWALSDVAGADYYGDMKDDVVYNEIRMTFQDWELVLTGAQLYEMGIEDIEGFAGRNNTIAIEELELNQI
ncbi:MAG: hypothetical protein U9N61_01625 [Euryarchaeota archaeon]|nr:hypothetical protein [Euryarchaeota archaeon]